MTLSAYSLRPVSDRQRNAIEHFVGVDIEPFLGCSVVHMQTIKAKLILCSLASTLLLAVVQ